MKRVLLVDDDAVQRKLSGLLLSAAGYDVQMAEGAEAALEAAAHRAPDAILSDVLMGDFDGFELCRRVRGTRALDAVPVVLTSAEFNQPVDQQLAQQVGANALVSRTSDLREELAALARSLDEGARQADPADLERAKASHLGRMARQLSSLAQRASNTQKQYEAVVDHVHDAVALIDPRGYVRHANRRWGQILKVSPASMVGQHMFKFTPAELRETHQQRFDEMVEKGGERTTAPVAITAVDGTVTLMEFSSSCVEIDGERLVLSIARDVTDSARTTAALKASEERYRRLIEHLPDVAWSASEAGGTSFITENVQRVCGLSQAEVYALGPLGWYQRIHPQDQKATALAFRRFMADPEATYDVTYRWRRNDGSYLWLHARANTRYRVDGVDCCDGLFNDVTRQRELEADLRQSQKMEAVGQLAGGVAHDFNNLLTVIMANAHLLSMDLSADDPRQQSATEIQQAATRAAGLTRQLLAFSRKQVLRPELVHTGTIAQQLCKMLGRLIGEDIALELACDSELWPVKIDLGQMEQVLINLAVNARDAMPGGGQISIASRNVEVPVELHTASGTLAPGQYVAVSVRDVGTGIAPDVLTRIFEPFFTTKAQGQGTGLGLSTVFAIVTANGGAIAVDSTLGKGTTFTVYLPRAAGAATAPTATAAGPRTAQRASQTVLLVEDDEQVSMVARRILSSAGYSVLEARTGEQAHALLESYRGQVHLVLSDVVMPGASGPEVVASLRQSRPDLRVLYMSGYSDHAVLKARVLEASEQLLQKPFTPSSLLDRVRDVLAAPSPSPAPGLG